MNVVGAHVILHRMVATGRNQILVVLLHKRTQDAPTYPGYWGLFGGGLDGQDHGNALEAVKRELAEELEGGDQAAEYVTELCRVPIAREGQTFAIQYYRAPLNADMDKLRLKRTNNKVEGEGIAWFTAEEIHHLWLRSEDRIALRKFFESAG